MNDPFDVYPVNINELFESAVKRVFSTTSNGVFTYGSVNAVASRQIFVEKDGQKKVYNLVVDDDGRLTLGTFPHISDVVFGFFQVPGISPVKTPKNFLGDGATVKNFVDDVESIVVKNNFKTPLTFGRIFYNFPNIRSRQLFEELVANPSPDIDIWLRMAEGNAKWDKKIEPPDVLQKATEKNLRRFVADFGRPFWPWETKVNGNVVSEILSMRPISVRFAGKDVMFLHDLQMLNGKNAHVKIIDSLRDGYEISIDSRLGVFVNTSEMPPAFKNVSGDKLQALEIRQAIASEFFKTQKPEDICRFSEMAVKKKLDPKDFLTGYYLLTDAFFRRLDDKEHQMLAEVTAYASRIKWEKTPFSVGKTFDLVVVDVGRSTIFGPDDRVKRGRFVVGVGEKDGTGKVVYRLPVERYFVGGERAISEKAVKSFLEKKERQNERGNFERG